MIRLSGEGWSQGVLTALIVLSALTAYLWPYGYSAFTPIAAMALIPVFRPRGANLTLIVLVIICLYAVATTAWSPVFSATGPIESYADAEAQTWGKLPMQLGLYALLVVLAAYLPGERLARLKTPFAVGAVLLAVWLIAEALMGAAIYQSLKELIGEPTTPDQARRNVALASYALALMYWPAVRIFLDRGQRRPVAVLTLGALLPPFLLSAMAPLAALVISGAAYVLARRTSGRGAMAVGAAAAVATLAGPWLVLLAEPLFETIAPHVGASWAARLEIWRFSAEQVLAHPLTGWGIDGSRAFLPFMLHPHSAPLQLWLELGAIGAGLAAVFWMLLYRRAQGLGAHAVAAATVYFVIGALSFGVWQEWWLGLAAMTAVWSLVAAAPEYRQASVIEA